MKRPTGTNTGIITWYNLRLGYGFLRDLNNPLTKSIFVHRTNIIGRKLLKEGDIIEFDLYEGHLPNTLIAKNIVKLD